MLRMVQKFFYEDSFKYMSNILHDNVLRQMNINRDFPHLLEIIYKHEASPLRIFIMKLHSFGIFKFFWTSEIFTIKISTGIILFSVVLLPDLNQKCVQFFLHKPNFDASLAGSYFISTLVVLNIGAKVFFFINKYNCFLSKLFYPL